MSTQGELKQLMYSLLIHTPYHSQRAAQVALHSINNPDICLMRDKPVNIFWMMSSLFNHFIHCTRQFFNSMFNTSCPFICMTNRAECSDSPRQHIVYHGNGHQCAALWITPQSCGASSEASRMTAPAPSPNKTQVVLSSQFRSLVKLSAR